MKTPTEVAQAQLDAYNAQDLDAHVAYFADDVKVADLNGAVTIEGIEAYRARYAKVFAEFPENKAVLVNRITIGNVVIDHERVSRSPSATPFEVAAIYTISDGKIRRVDFVK
ncbi:MAG: nuclear transport factor 2 family protein [Myxococcales bacterium]|nr:nuclear transport factor 2 family protein [Myxococcales bacterium]